LPDPKRKQNFNKGETSTGRRGAPMDSEYQEAREKILFATLPNVAFDGWVERTLKMGAESAGYEPEMALRVFPGGAREAIRFWSERDDQWMLAQMGKEDLAAMPFREHLAKAIRLRIDVNAPHREAVRRTMSFLAMPQNYAAATRNTFDTVSAIWYAVGDTSTDLNFYTKRLTLAPIYVATVLYWIDDTSEDSAETWAFLDRRLEDSRIIPRLQARLGETLGALTSPFSSRSRWSRRRTSRRRSV
jgi:ubiquinone biosynthesis protein COQ9